MSSNHPSPGMTPRQRLVLALWAAGFVLVAFSVMKMAFAYRRVQLDRMVAQEDLERTQKQYDTLSESVSRLSTPRGKEEELRTQYRAILPGEKLIVVLPDEDAQEEVRLSFGQRLGHGISAAWKGITGTIVRLFTVPESDTIDR